MDSISEDDEGYYQGKFLPARLAERAARVTDSTQQFTLSAFKSPEASQFIASIRRQQKKDQEDWDNFVASQKRRNAL